MIHFVLTCYNGVYSFSNVITTSFKFQMALCPLFKMNDAGDSLTKVRAHRQAYPTVTKYRVLDSSSGCSLVELLPLTSKKCVLWGGGFVRRNNYKISVQFHYRKSDFLSCTHRSEAPDEGSHGICSDMPRSW